ncbi:imm11 family protein [Butyrivibrio sp. MC2013]|uniref:imm11 family protein n=1 Tax=Butyrivibrio sp. MC2013 TaxID=1280686 RepID=UPI00047E05B3|nr:DUF1629 domain-containing protein [Butyrivibrio sp. MC2013]
MIYYDMDYSYSRSKDAIFCTELSDQSLYDLHDFHRGTYIPKKGKLIYTYDPGEGNIITDFINNKRDWFIISSRCYHVLKQELYTGVQFLPIVIRNGKDGSNTMGYIVNILHVLEGAINFEKSGYGVLKDGDKKIYAIWKYVLNENIIQNYDLFRLKEHSVAMFCSEKIKSIIEQEKLTGFSFKKIDVI